MIFVMKARGLPPGDGELSGAIPPSCSWSLGRALEERRLWCRWRERQDQITEKAEKKIRGDGGLLLDLKRAKKDRCRQRRSSEGPGLHILSPLIPSND